MSKPSTYLNWTNGGPTVVTQPPSSLQTSGWTPGEIPPPDYMNWLFWLTDQWIQWLDSLTTAFPATGVSASNTNHNIATGTNVQTQLDELDFAQLRTHSLSNPGTTTYPLVLASGSSPGDNGALFLINTSLSAVGGLTFNLPVPTNNFYFKVKDVSGNIDRFPITFHRHGSELFENLAVDYIFAAPFGELTIWCDGTNYFLVG